MTYYIKNRIRSNKVFRYRPNKSERVQVGERRDEEREEKRRRERDYIRKDLILPLCGPRESKRERKSPSPVGSPSVSYVLKMLGKSVKSAKNAEKR